MADSTLGSEQEACKAIALLGDNASKKNLTEENMLVDVPLLGQGGIRSSELVSAAFKLHKIIFSHS